MQPSFGSQLYDVDDGGFDGDDVDVQVDGDDVVVLVVDLLGSQLDLSGSGSHPSGSARHKIYILPNIFCQKILFVAEFLLPIFAQFSCH